MRLLYGGTPQLRADQTWAARLLYAGLQDGQDADLYRRKYIIEQTCALHDGPSGSADPFLRGLLMGIVSRAASMPALAKHLVLNTGEWASSLI